MMMPPILCLACCTKSPKSVAFPSVAIVYIVNRICIDGVIPPPPNVNPRVDDDNPAFHPFFQLLIHQILVALPPVDYKDCYNIILLRADCSITL